MIICTKEKCVWRNDIQEDKAYCFMSICPHARETKIKYKKIKVPVKWAGLIGKDISYQRKKGEK